MGFEKITQYIVTVILLAGSLLLAFIALLIYTQAPTYDWWKVSLIAVECPWWFIGACLVLMLPSLYYFLRNPKKRTPQYIAGAAGGILLIAVALYTIPVVATMAQAGRLGVPINMFTALFGDTFDEPAVMKKDIVFNDTEPKLQLDLYSPSLPANATQLLPVILVIHGGGWNHGKKSDFEKIDRWLAAHGFLVLDTDYRLADGTVRFPSQIDDVHLVLDWLKKHAAEYRADPSRLALIGRSAGGQIALCEAYQHPDAVKVVVSFYGPTDLVWGYYNVIKPDVLNATFLLENYLGGTPESAKETYWAASPLMLARKDSPATMMIYGDTDQLVSPHHAVMLSSKLKELGVPHEFLQLEYADHAFDANPSGLHSQIALDQMLTFLKKHL